MNPPRAPARLERQRGGFGFLGGPGETQIEADRRHIDERITRIRRDLVRTTRTRRLHRDNRARVPWPVAALVGYTNAGKSTLFNRIAGAGVFAEDMLFATLEPTMRAVELPSGRRIILSDTVGFISDLPTQLVAAFRATLEEVIEADLILHVRDIAHPDTEAQAADVGRVLAELGRGPEAEARTIEVRNKIDLLDGEARTRVFNGAERKGRRRRPSAGRARPRRPRPLPQAPGRPAAGRAGGLATAGFEIPVRALLTRCGRAPISVAL